ncbi:transposase [Sunxiuqinia indica]|uniref:transposase n=1 Tax=Sunxiuqinia indica TaxID=2692584 RepID=UPI0013595112|nr:transposase [Sunxiuqinia indica]
MQVENFKQTYDCSSKVFLGDKIFQTRENRKCLKEKGIKIYGKPMGRPPKNDSQTAGQKYRDKKEASKRNHVESKFGQAKRGYGLNNIMVRLPETSESWINAILFVMNLAKLLQVAKKWKDSFMLLSKNLKTAIKNLVRLKLFACT